MLTVATTFAAENPTRTYDVYVYDNLVDGTSAYDRVILTRVGVLKDASQAAANLGVGDWFDVRLTKDNEVWFIEANANPFLSYGHDSAESAHKAGLRYDAFIQRIVDEAMSRPA